jgi:hypothetical protein
MCIGNFGQSTDLCISSNGRVVSSTYLFRKYYKTKGTTPAALARQPKSTAPVAALKPLTATAS